MNQPQIFSRAEWLVARKAQQGRNGMNLANNQTAAAAELRKSIDDWAEAIRAKDLARVMAHYAADVVLFDLAPPLQYVGADAIRKSLEGWFPTFHGRVGYEMRDLSLNTNDDLGFSRSLNRISGARTSGEQTDVWVRATVCFRKIDGAWKITHEHVSAPFYMDGSDRAATDLKP